MILIDNQRVNWGNGRREITGPIPDGVGGNIAISFKHCTTADSSNWADPATEIDLILSISFDNKATWKEVARFVGSHGGINYDRFQGQNVERQESSLLCYLPDGVGRFFRLQTDIRNGPFRTNVTVVTI